MVNPAKRPNLILELLAYAAIGLLLGGIFFRQIISSHFDLLCGDRIDSRLNAVILEHWWQVLRGSAAWLSPPFFFPTQGVLGYSDAGFLHALPYMALRFIGIEPLTSYQIVLLALPAAGWIGIILFLRCCLKLGIIPTIVGAALFVFPNSMAVSALHTQLFAIYFIPWLAVGICLFLDTFDKPTVVGIASGIFLAILVPALFYTSYYVGWFSILFILLLSLVSCAWAALHSGGNVIWRRIVWTPLTWRNILPYCALSAVCFIPFLVTYIPVLRQFGSRGYQEVATMEPSFIDYINVGPDNWLWGNVLYAAAPGLGSRQVTYELTKGVSWCLLLTFLPSSVYFISKIKHCRLAVAQSGACTLVVDGNKADHSSKLEMLAAGMGAAVLLAWLLILKIGDHSLWWSVSKILPGAGSIRAVYRFQHVLAFPIAIVVAIALHQLMKWAARRRFAGAALGVVCALLLAEQFNTGTLARWSKQQQLNMLAAIPRPPPQGKVFALWPASGSKVKKAPYEVQIDAMVIAQRYGLRTINGYSGQFPPGWAGISAFDKPSYIWALDRWIQHYNLEGDGLYVLDVKTAAWLPAEECRLTLPNAGDAQLAALKGKQDIRELNLANSRVTDAGLALLRDMPNLQELYLRNTRVTDAGLAQLGDLQNLQTLRLGNTQITDAGMALFKQMKALTVLDLSDTQVTDAGLAPLRQIQALQMLVLGNTKISDAGLAYLEAMKNLQVLSLSDTQVTDAGLAKLKDMGALQMLVLGDTRVTDAGLARLRAMKGLQVLALYNTQVTDAGLAQLKGMTSLLTLDLRGTQVTDTGLADLKSALPSLQIVR